MGFHQEEATREQQVKTVGISDRRDIDLLRTLQPHDLIKYGFIPEFIGRMPVSAVLEDLSKEALVQILTKPKNAIIRQLRACTRALPMRSSHTCAAARYGVTGSRVLE